MKNTRASTLMLKVSNDELGNPHERFAAFFSFIRSASKKEMPKEMPKEIPLYAYLSAVFAWVVLFFVFSFIFTRWLT